MDSTLKPLKAALEAIRDMALNALDQIEQSQETRSMRWVCKECPVREAFYEARFIGNRWQMPPMQKYGLILFYERGRPCVPDLNECHHLFPSISASASPASLPITCGSDRA